MGWTEAADKILMALSKTISSGKVTYDLARQMPGSVEVKVKVTASGMLVTFG
jgi:isocitrate dehydrogenase